MRRYSKGDRVRFLNDTGGGVIVRTEGESLYYVQTEDGFEIPAAARELVPDTGLETTGMKDAGKAKDFSMDHSEPVKAKQGAPEYTIPLKEPAGTRSAIPENPGDDGYLTLLAGIVPEEGEPVFKACKGLYLINDSKYAVYFLLGTFERGLYVYLSSGILEPETKQLIRTFTQSEISSLSGLHIQAICLNRGRYQRKAPVDNLVDLKPYNFSRESYYAENEYFDTRAVILVISGKEGRVVPEGLTEELPVHETSKKDFVAESSSGTGKRTFTDTMEVDLHADELVEENRQLSPSAILSLQMKHFHAAMEEAISKKMRKIVIIHGVGQGTLKLQVRKELQEKYPQYAFQDASFKEYGFGATLVHLHIIKKQ